tara:strand:- start:5966 stop:7921 length:1956 start_codon:yes stop_codon:yes gene_type:complete
METHFISEDADQHQSNMEIIKNQIQTLDSEQLLSVLEDEEKNWGLQTKNNTRVSFELGYRKFFRPDEINLKTGKPFTVNLENVSTTHMRFITQMGQIYHRAVALEIDKYEPEDDGLNVASRINRVIEQIDDAFQIVHRDTRIYERINKPTKVLIAPESDPSLFRCNTSEIETLSPYQRSLISFLNHTYINNIRRYKGYCCTQIITAEGYTTRAWKAVRTVEAEVYRFSQKETNRANWENLTSKGSTINDVIRHASKCYDIQFPEIVKNRHVWSFKNGLFIGKEYVPATGKYRSKFYSYDSKEYQCLDPTIVSCKYFDQVFDGYEHLEDWWDIPTPYFQSILDYQGFDKNVAKWMYVMGGRLCYDVGDLDGWQIAMYCKGVARTGKSTLLTNVFQKFYEAEDVKTLSSNSEKQFGLSAIYDGFMFIAPECKTNMSLNQAELQSIISGEDVSVAVKHEKAKSIKWVTPGCMAGNELPDYKDASGSILRRLLVFDFPKQVKDKDADPHLNNKLAGEIPAILLKCIRAYIEYGQKYADKDAWAVVPAYFKKIQKQVAMVTSSLTNFLESSAVDRGTKLFVPQQVFTPAYTIHCTQTLNLGKPRFNPDTYAGPFSSYGIEVREEAVTYKGRSYRKQPVFYGVDVVDDNEEILRNGY